MAEDEFLQRRESRFLRAPKNQKAAASNTLETTAQLAGVGAADERRPPSPTRMKIVVKKGDLKQLLEAIRYGGGAARRGTSTSAPAGISLEHRLNLMRRMQMLRATSHAKGRSRMGLGTWRPVLHSIPE